jgi:uncharacterized protein YgiM (DUF1202 family)
MTQASIFPMRCLTILGLIAASFGTISQAQNDEIRAVAHQTVNVRGGPGTQFDIVGQLNAEDQVEVLGRDTLRTGWLQIALPESDSELTGWVASFTVSLDGEADSLPLVQMSTPTPEPESAAASPRILSFGRVNLRSGPSVSNEIIGQLDVDDEATIMARSNFNNDWLYVENEAAAGWVAYFTVTVLGPLDEIQVLVPDTVTGELVPPSTLLSANFNVQVHRSPSFASPTLVVIPFQTEVSPLGISENGRWLYVIYEDEAGWAWAGLFTLTDEQRDLIPLRQADPPTA